MYQIDIYIVHKCIMYITWYMSFQKSRPPSLLLIAPGYKGYKGVVKWVDVSLSPPPCALRLRTRI